MIDVSDQGSDTFEFLEHEFHSGRRFVVRACKVRKVYAGHKPIGRTRYFKEYADSLPEMGRFTMDEKNAPIEYETPLTNGRVNAKRFVQPDSHTPFSQSKPENSAKAPSLHTTLSCPRDNRARINFNPNHSAGRVQVHFVAAVFQVRT